GGPRRAGPSPPAGPPAARRGGPGAAAPELLPGQEPRGRARKRRPGWRGSRCRWPPAGVYPPRPHGHPPFLGHGVGAVAREPAERARFLGRERPPTGHKRLPERPGLGPYGQDFVACWVVHDRLPLGVWRYGEALPLPARIP